MNSFEKKIQEHNNLQKSVVESLTGQNEVQDIVDCLLKAGVAEEDLVEKAKYIRREGTKGNYKYIYDEPKENKKERESGMDFKEGQKVKIASNLTTDPVNKQGESGIVHKIYPDKISVKFSDGTIGYYQDEVLENQTQKKEEVYKVNLESDKQLVDIKRGDKLVLTDSAKNSKEDSSSLNIIQRRKDDIFTFDGMAGGTLRVLDSTGDSHILSATRFKLHKSESSDV